MVLIERQKHCYRSDINACEKAWSLLKRFVTRLWIGPTPRKLTKRA
jgi:hypothetical protein